MRISMGYFWFWVGLMLAGVVTVRAQPGAPLREVTRLARVPEPPGGLIPYRAGTLWGYADTTGRIVIRPCISWATIQETTLFDHGFAVIRAAIEPSAVQALVSQTPGTEPSEPEAYRLLVLNARGELLRVRQSEAAVQQPDGSLRCLPRPLARGQRELTALIREEWQNTGFNAGSFRRVSAAGSAPALPPLPPGAFRGERIGAHRVAWATSPAAGRRTGTSRRRLRLPQELYALGASTATCSRPTGLSPSTPFTKGGRP